jgi:hypothetical protein
MVTQRRTIPLTEPFRVIPQKIRHSNLHLAPQQINPRIPTQSSLQLTPPNRTTQRLMVEATPFPLILLFLREEVTSRQSLLRTQARAGGGSRASPTSVYAPTR